MSASILKSVIVVKIEKIISTKFVVQHFVVTATVVQLDRCTTVAQQFSCESKPTYTRKAGTTVQICSK